MGYVSDDDFNLRHNAADEVVRLLTGFINHLKGRQLTHDPRQTTLDYVSPASFRTWTMFSLAIARAFSAPCWRISSTLPDASSSARRA